MPMSSGRPEAGLPPSATTRRFSSSKRPRSASSPGQQVGVAGLDDRHPAQHLPDDDLDVLVVDRHTLLAVDAAGPRRPGASATARGPRMRSTCFGSIAPWISWWPTSTCSPSGDEQARALGDRVGVLLGAVVRREHDATGLVGLLDRDPAGGLGDRGDTLGGARLEELDDTRQTLRDVVTGHTTGVEGTHRQLGAGLTDRLGGDDADGLADVDELAGRQRAAVAARRRCRPWTRR